MEGSIAQALGWSGLDVLLFALAGGGLAFFISAALQWRAVRESWRCYVLGRAAREANHRRDTRRWSALR